MVNENDNELNLFDLNEIYQILLLYQGIKWRVKYNKIFNKNYNFEVVIHIFFILILLFFSNYYK